MVVSPLGGSETNRRSRGQSEILGVVLLLGFVAVGAVGILVVGAEVTTSAQQQAETERVNQAFVELSHQMATAVTNDDVSHSMNFDAGEHGAITREEAGWINVSSDGLSEPINETIGTIEYRANDGSVLAFEGGGVYRETGNETVVVSPPSIHYDSDEETLTLPVTTVSGDDILGTGNIRINHHETTTYRHANVVENESIYVTISSDYYRGWQRFFESEAGDTSIRAIDHENQTITVRLGFDEIEEAFDDGVGVPSDNNVDDHNDMIGEDNINTNLKVPPLDDIIDEMIEDAKNGHLELDADLSEQSDPSGTYDDGTYYIDEIESGEYFEFNISEGNVTLIVEGDMTVDEHIKAINPQPDTVVKIYSGGDRLTLDGEICGSEDCENESAKHMQVYGTSSMGVDFGASQAGTLHGVLYAAAEEEKEEPWLPDTNTNPCDMDNPQMMFQANDFDVSGAIVAYSICTQSSGGSFEYDDSLDTVDFDVYPDNYSLPPQLTYLNIVHHELEVKND